MRASVFHRVVGESNTLPTIVGGEDEHENVFRLYLVGAALIKLNIKMSHFIKLFYAELRNCAVYNFACGKNIHKHNTIIFEI